MGLSVNGLQSGGAPAGGATTDISARSFTATQVAGADAFAATVAGARWHIGPGTTDYFSSNGSETITAAGRLGVTTELQVPTNALLYLDTGRTIGFSFNGTILRTIGAAALTPGSDQSINLGATATRWSNLFATSINLGVSGALTHSATAPTVVAGAGASVTAGGACAFDIDLGGAAQTGTITLPAATTGWVVTLQNVTTPASFIISQTGGTQTTATFTCYSRTTGLAANWNANDHARCTAVAY